MLPRLPLAARTLRLASAALALFTAFALAAPAQAAEILRNGTFKGVSGHRSSGSVEIVKDGNVTKVVFKSDFKLKDAPDPTLAWGNDGFKRGTFFGKLKKLDGAQEYAIPAGTDLSQYNEFWLWCERFNVGLAVARLQ